VRVVELSNYQHRFPNIEIGRHDGVIEVRVRGDDGGPMQWGIDPGAIHEQLPEAFYAIGRDRENRAMIFTGTGDTFCVARDPAKYTCMDGPEHIYRILREARDMLVNLLEIEVPVISAINGPASYHPELTVLADVVLATPEVWFQDSHLRGNLAAGDGGQVIWQQILGPTRGAYFLMTSEKLTVQKALAYGAVHEIVPADRLLPRAREIAGQLLTKSVSTLRYTRIALNQYFKERMTHELTGGLTAELLGYNCEVGQSDGKK
jgi:enoyl-CoA hydratase/carnithine racemase